MPNLQVCRPLTAVLTRGLSRGLTAGLAAALLAGCAVGSSSAPQTSQPPTFVDYADNLRWEGREYLGAPDTFTPFSLPTPRPEDVGALLFTVACPGTSGTAGTAGVGTAGTAGVGTAGTAGVGTAGTAGATTGPRVPGTGQRLTCGTAFHELRGWPAECRVVSVRDSRLRVYAAVRGNSLLPCPGRS